MLTVYVIKSTKTGRFYVGQTNNLRRRLYEHNSGQTPSIRGRGPYVLVFKETYNSRIEAVQRERFLKTGKGREEMAQILFHMSQ